MYRISTGLGAILILGGCATTAPVVFDTPPPAVLSYTPYSGTDDGPVQISPTVLPEEIVVELQKPTPTPNPEPVIVTEKPADPAPARINTPTPQPTPEGPVKKMSFDLPNSALTQMKTSGVFSEADIQAIVVKHLPEVRSCYEKGLKEFPAIEGIVETDFSILPSGKIATAKIKRTTLHSTTTELCLIGSIKTWQFPRFSGSRRADVSYPFSLKWGSNFAEIGRKMEGCWDATLAQGPLRYLSVGFDKKGQQPRALVATERNSGNARLPKTLMGFPAELSAANLRSNRISFVINRPGGKLSFTGTWRDPSNMFVGTLLSDNKRQFVSFQRKQCAQSILALGLWEYSPKLEDLQKIQAPRKNTRVASTKRK